MVSSERSRMDENGKDEKLDGWGEVTVGNKRLANKRESLRVSSLRQLYTTKHL